MTAPNKHPITGIAYGVLALGNIHPDIVEVLLYGKQVRDVRHEAAKSAAITAGRLKYGNDFDEMRCVDALNDTWQDDEPEYMGRHQDVEYHCTWMGGAQMLWVFESPHIAHCVGCSPCCPGAGDLARPGLFGMATYNVPDDWRDNPDEVV